MNSPMTLSDFLKKLKESPESVDFSDTISVIDDNYSYHATAFNNGDLCNKAGENDGSCKILAFACLQGLSEKQTLACFGSYYRDDVLKHPDGDNHRNIRQFMKTGWEGVSFRSSPLVVKKTGG